jgi:hypothetical protein
MRRLPHFLVSLLLTMLIPSASFAQVDPPPQAEPIEPPLFVVTVNGHDGFIDPHGKIVIEPAFEKAFPSLTDSPLSRSAACGGSSTHRAAS